MKLNSENKKKRNKTVVLKNNKEKFFDHTVR